MAVGYNPRIVTDGLAFAYDMFNTQKSWKGAPTTNLAPFTDYSDRTYYIRYNVGGFGGDDADVFYYPNGGYNNLPYKKMIKHTGGTGGSFNTDHATFTLEEGKTYRVSCWMKASRAVTLNGYALDLNRSTDNAYRVGGNISVTTEWQRLGWVYTCAVGEGGTYQSRQIIYIDDLLPTEIYWCGFQVEENSIYTPYVKGTRSNTQAILDLVNRSTVTANSVTYDNDGMFSFNGTSNYITIPINCDKTYYSINWWMYPATRTSFNQWLSFNDSWNNWVFHTTSSGEVYTGTDVATRMTPTNLPANTVLTNVWQNFTYTFNNGVGKFYKNGILLSTKSGMNISANTFTNFYVGSPSQGVNTVNGKVSNLGIYSNRVLTDIEVKQNFDTIRIRYGI